MAGLAADTAGTGLCHHLGLSAALQGLGDLGDKALSAGSAQGHGLHTNRNSRETRKQEVCKENRVGSS